MKTGNKVAIRLGRFSMLKSIALLLALAVLAMSGRGALAETPGAGIERDGVYLGVQFSWGVLWQRPWTVDEQQTATEPGQYDRLVLHDADATIRMIFDFDQDPSEALATMIQVTSISEGGATILGTDSGTDGFGWPYVSATLSYHGLLSDGTDEPTIEYIEAGPAYTMDHQFGVHLTSLIVPESKFPDAFATAQANVVSNLAQAGSFFVGNPSGIPGLDEGVPSGSADVQISESDYLAQLNSELGTLADSIDAFHTLILQDPNFSNEQSINDLAAILATWMNAYDTAQAINPPAGYEQVHKLYLGFTSLLSGAALDIVQGNMDAASHKLERALTKLKKLESTLQQGSGDLLNQKSG